MTMESDREQKKARRSGSAVVTKEEVIAKLKDDGDFDNLRRGIIRKLKDNEELRNGIVEMVIQSSALNRVGAENMKPRQLSDAIYEEVGEKMMGRISDGLWQIIRSGDGMKNEIMETVQAVYDNLTGHERKKEGEPTSSHAAMVVQNEAGDKETINALARAADDNLSDAEPQEPPGFSLPSNSYQNSSYACKEESQQSIPCEGLAEERKECSNYSKDAQELFAVDVGATHGFSADEEHKPLGDGSDEDPDVPPGFG